MMTGFHSWTNHIGAERWQMSLGVQVIFLSFFPPTNYNAGCKPAFDDEMPLLQDMNERH